MNQNAEAPASAVRHIEENLAGRLGLSDVAASTNYSKHYLHRRFSRDAGMTMGDYISRRRLTEAAKMLVFTDWPVLDIAMSVGFGSQQSFSAAFKRMFKKTPGSTALQMSSGRSSRGCASKAVRPEARACPCASHTLLTGATGWLCSTRWWTATRTSTRRST